MIIIQIQRIFRLYKRADKSANNIIITQVLIPWLFSLQRLNTAGETAGSVAVLDQFS